LTTPVSVQLSEIAKMISHFFPLYVSDRLFSLRFFELNKGETNTIKKSLLKNDSYAAWVKPPGGYDCVHIVYRLGWSLVASA
jgi:hypothetical protein